MARGKYVYVLHERDPMGLQAQYALRGAYTVKRDALWEVKRLGWRDDRYALTRVLHGSIGQECQSMSIVDELAKMEANGWR